MKSEPPATALPFTRIGASSLLLLPRPKPCPAKKKKDQGPAGVQHKTGYCCSLLKRGLLKRGRGSGVLTPRSSAPHRLLPLVEMPRPRCCMARVPLAVWLAPLSGKAEGGVLAGPG